jgi:hypothetical protein
MRNTTTPQTATGTYLKEMANGGHYRQKLGEAALALTECFCKADLGNRKEMGEALCHQVFTVLRTVYGWDHNSAVDATSVLSESFRRTMYGSNDRKLPKLLGEEPR